MSSSYSSLQSSPLSQDTSPSEFSEKMGDCHRDLPPRPDRVSRVLIAGGGFGAVFLALLLERLNIPYYLFEGASKPQHLSAALMLGPSVLPIFEQLGVIGLLASISLPCPSLGVFDQKMKKLGEINCSSYVKITGYENLICARLHLHELLLSHLNPQNIIMNKKILSYEENELGVNVCCSDNSVYCGDILVGADGLHSRIRQTLHRVLARKNMLSRADREPIVPSYVCVAGVARRQSAEKYPSLKDPFVHFDNVVGQKGNGWHVINIPDDQICWAMWIPVDPLQAVEEKNTESSEFGVANTEPIVKQFRNMPCPQGGTMGELVDATSEDLKSKVYVTERLFETWHHGRTVLLGDACHSMLPWGGQGVPSEIQDAVILANCIFELKDLSLKSITDGFKDYQCQRSPHVRSQTLGSRKLAQLCCGQSFKERITRYLFLNWIPDSYQDRLIEESGTYRPQACFLNKAETRGRGTILPQKSNRQWTEDQVSAKVSSVWGKLKVM